MPAACHIDLLISPVYNRFSCMAGRMCKFACNATVKFYSTTLVIQHQYNILIQVTIDIITDLELCGFFSIICLDLIGSCILYGWEICLLAEHLWWWIVGSFFRQICWIYGLVWCYIYYFKWLCIFSDHSSNLGIAGQITNLVHIDSHRIRCCFYLLCTGSINCL